MTQVAVQTRSAVMRVRATFEQVEALTITDAQDALFGLGGLVYVAHVRAEAETLGAQSYNIPAFAEVLDRHAKSAVSTTRVEHVSYNSPLEIVLTISAVGASIATLGTAVISVWRQADGLRTKLSRGRLERAAMAAILQDLAERRIATDELRRRDHVDLLLEGAATAAGQLTNVQIEAEDG
jgi:hypothetical protein